MLSDFRAAMYGNAIVCAHCRLRHHPPYGAGCYAGRYSVVDGPSSYTLLQQRRDEDAEREETTP